MAFGRLIRNSRPRARAIRTIILNDGFDPPEDPPHYRDLAPQAAGQLRVADAILLHHAGHLLREVDHGQLGHVLGGFPGLVKEAHVFSSFLLALTCPAPAPP